MQKINYNEIIVLEEKITELLVINIDDKLNQSKDSDSIKVSGEIAISGEAKCLSGNKNFFHPINVELLVGKEQLVTEEVNLSIDDFSYKLIDNKIDIDLIIKIDGLREIEPYFLPQEDQEITQIEEETKEEVQIDVQEDTDLIEQEERKISLENKEVANVIEEEIIEVPKETIEPINTGFTNSEKEKNYSLLSQIFKKGSLKKETCFLYHVVKNETTYKEIATLYSVDELDLVKLNNDEEIYKGKLVLIPRK